jgi:carbamoyl-phosphate synthase large subunit
MPAKGKKKIMILGGGPNRIGQGIEFDYCCVHASFALREAGFETVMVNSNPETVSTDYDTSDRLYFEPLTLEDVLEIYEQEQCSGVIVQFGGQTPLNLATALKKAGVNVIGTSPESIEAAEDRKLFSAILTETRLKSPDHRTALNEPDALAAAHQIGFPVLLRPSFVLGGRGMFIVYSEDEFKSVVRQAFDVMPDKPVLIDKFLEDAIELDVDCISDGTTTVIGGMLEHIEFAGVHSGDAAMVMPPHTLGKAMLDEVRRATHDLARALKVVGLMNVQYAIKDGQLYVLEVNPRASRTVPFVAKAIGVPLAKLAARVMTGAKLADLGFTREQTPKHWCVKEAVFPFARFPGVDVLLGPEMRSTGEVIGLDHSFGVAFAKSQIGGGTKVPKSGTVFVSMRERDKPRILESVRLLVDLGFRVVATSGTQRFLAVNGVASDTINKVLEGRPHVVDAIKNGEIQLVFNTTEGKQALTDSRSLRRAALLHKVPYYTTLAGAVAAVQGIKAYLGGDLEVRALQDYFIAVD